MHGSRFILLEFGIGTPAILVLGALTMLSGTQFPLGLYLSLTGINYVPVLIYPVIIARKGSAKTEVAFGLDHDEHYVRKYSLQQLIIFIPLAILIIAIIQELSHQKTL